MPTSSGLLLYRDTDQGVEVLLGHMGGPFWARKQARAWSIPKGEHDAAEDPHAAAVREFTEEIGQPPPPGPEFSLGTVQQRGGKTVTAWARRADLDVSTIRSNTFEIEWPPGSGRLQSFAEMDRAEWFDLTAARAAIVKGQWPALDAVARRY